MRRLFCLFRGHQWHIEENYATQGTEQECVRCGAHRSTFPGDPKLPPRIPPTGYEAGGPVAFPVGGHGSHLMGDLAEADALIVVPAEEDLVRDGALVDVLMLDQDF